jgi:hypothetical protein
VTAAEDHWSKTALDGLAALPGHLRDQVEALVREICRDPSGPLAREVPSLDRTWLVEASEVAVYYQVSRGGDFILVNDVIRRS